MEGKVTRKEFVDAVGLMADQVWDFHERWRLPPFDCSKKSAKKAVSERQPILEEEIVELSDALKSGSVTEISDEVADVLFVAIGHAQSLLSPGIAGIKRVTIKNAKKTEQTHKIRSDTGKLLPIKGKPHKWR